MEFEGDYQLFNDVYSMTRYTFFSNKIYDKILLSAPISYSIALISIMIIYVTFIFCLGNDNIFWKGVLISMMLTVAYATFIQCYRFYKNIRSADLYSHPYIKIFNILMYCLIVIEIFFVGFFQISWTYLSAWIVIYCSLILIVPILIHIHVDTITTLVNDQEFMDAVYKKYYKIKERQTKFHKIKFNPSINYTNCPVCLEDYINKETLCELQCHHIYHEKCIRKWIREKRECAMCRTSIDDVQNNRTIANIENDDVVIDMENNYDDLVTNIENVHNDDIVINMEMIQYDEPLYDQYNDIDLTDEPKRKIYYNNYVAGMDTESIKSDENT